MLKIVGDCNFADGFFDMGFGTGTSIKNGANPFQYIKDHSTEDYWIGNFECVCSSVSNKEGLDAKQFIILPSVCDNVDHLDFYGVANNHVMQHGQNAYREMVGYLEVKDVAYAGTNEKRTTVVEHQGKRVAITVFNQRPENFTKHPLYWAMPEYEAVSEELAKYAYCDYRMVYVHWGIEFINYPYNDQKQFAHYLVDCGADLIIGMHSHVMQGFEIYKGKHIFYSLGNCIFNMSWEPTKYSLMVNVDLVKENVFYQYLKIGDNYFPAYIDNVPEQYTMEHLNKLLDICEDNEFYFAKANDYLSQYRKANKKQIMKDVRKFNLSDLSAMITDFIKRKFL